MLLSYKPLHLEAQQRLQEEGCVVDISRHIEHLQIQAHVLMYGKLLLHLDVADAVGERGDDGLVRDLGDLETSVVEALDVLLEGLSWLLPDAAQVTRGRQAVASALEVGDEAVVHLIPGGDGARMQVQEP